MEELVQHPMVVQAFEKWAETTGTNAANRRLGDALDEFAVALGLSDRSQLLFGESKDLARLQEPMGLEDRVHLKQTIGSFFDALFNWLFVGAKAASYSNEASIELVRDQLELPWPW